METKYIAHRGFALKRMENTLDAFKYAAESSCYGIETDVHVTKDGEFVVFHDDSTLRLCREEHIIEETNCDRLQELRINDTFNNSKVKIPTLKEYLAICKSGKKNAVIELKNPMLKEQIKSLVEQIRKEEYLNSTTFISFDLNNCIVLRDILPCQAIQYITITYEEETLKLIADKKIDLDIEYTCLSKDRIKYCQNLGLKVNCWTLNDPEIAKHFEEAGIDFITSNNLGV